MSKDTFYFSHDYNARTDEKIKKLIKKHGMEGYGIFWSLVEDLYNNANEMKTDFESISYDLRVDVEVVKSVIKNFDLFCIRKNAFGSASISRRIDARNEKSAKARQSAFKRWGKDANALPPDANAYANASKNDAIKDSIGKDSIGKDSKEEENPPLPESFIHSIIEQFQSVFPTYIITTPGKEKASAGKLLAVFKSQFPEYGSDEMLTELRRYFEACKTIGDTWYRDNMSLTLMVSKYNEINNILSKPAQHKPGEKYLIEGAHMDYEQKL